MRKKLFISLGILFGLAVTTGCSSTQHYEVAGGQRAPGADWRAEVTSQEGGNFLVTLDVTNLPPPERLAEEMTTYVVWFVPGDQQAIRAGTLVYTPGSREGHLTATSGHSVFQVVVSAEAGPDVVTPSEHVVLRSNVEALQD